MNKKKYNKPKKRNTEDDFLSVSAVPTYKKGTAKKEAEANDKPKILILCEGQTEVNYFRGIIESETVYPNLIYATVVEMPESNQAKNLMLVAVYILQQTTKTKKIIDATKNYIEENYQKAVERLHKLALKKTGLDIDREIEKIKENRQGLKKYAIDLLNEGNTSQISPFDQIWLVFDNDDNNQEKQGFLIDLFAKAKEFGIQMAYSNRQFENWILLHFEQNNTIFLASECKNCLEGSKQVKKKYCDECRCGLSDFSKKDCANGNDCKGEICIGGYLRENKLHSFYKKGDWRKESGGNGKTTNEYCYEGLFDGSVKDFLNVSQDQEKAVFQKIRIAIQNAEWLRNQQGNPSPENSQNPYTDVDKLVKILINK